MHEFCSLIFIWNTVKQSLFLNTFDLSRRNSTYPLPWYGFLSNPVYFGVSRQLLLISQHLIKYEFTITTTLTMTIIMMMMIKFLNSLILIVIIMKHNSNKQQHSIVIINIIMLSRYHVALIYAVHDKTVLQKLIDNNQNRKRKNTIFDEKYFRSGVWQGGDFMYFVWYLCKSLIMSFIRVVARKWFELYL